MFKYHTNFEIKLNKNKEYLGFHFNACIMHAVLADGIIETFFIWVLIDSEQIADRNAIFDA